MMKQFTILFCSSLLLMSVGSCRWKTTRSAVKDGEALKSSIESFEDNREKLSEKLVDGLEDAKTALTKEKPDLVKVSKDFEKDWTSIQSRYKKLKDDFERVGKSSNDYFITLDDLSNNITNEKLKKEELGKNAALRNRWMSSYQQAEISINKITTVLEAGNDFHMVLVASSIRQKLEQNVDELNIIAAQAKTLLGDLEMFTQAGRDLVQG